MKIFYISVMFLSLILIIGCKGCINNLYQVHEEIPDIDISFVDSAISPQRVLNYLDSFRFRDTSIYVLDVNFNTDTLYKDQRIIKFKRSPEEYYRVRCNALPCWIMGVFNKQIDSSNWIFDRKNLSGTDIERIKSRFQFEILDKINRR
jgi:hypothetical protein